MGVLAMDAEQLANDASRIDELGRSIAKACIEWDVEALAAQINEFTELRSRISEYLIANPVVSLDDETSSAAKGIIRKLSTGKQLPIERALLANITECGLSEEQLEEIGFKELYSWISHVEYAQGLYEAGALVVGSGELPSHLEAYVREARDCYALQQYNAVCSLSRTILEVSVHALAREYGVLPQDYGNVAHLVPKDRMSFAKLIHELTSIPSFGYLRQDLHDIREKTNSIVHANCLVNRDGARKLLKQTLDSVHLLFEAHAMTGRGDRLTGRGDR